MSRTIRCGAGGVRQLMALVWLMLPAVATADGATESRHAGPQVAATAFAKLATLVGDWRTSAPGGSAIRVNYRFSAGDSVLVETWAMPSGRESLTLYHLDGDRLIATHYCPQGNQPRLQLDQVDASGRMGFVFRDGGNLGVAGAAHQHAMWLQLESPDRLWRSETYVDNLASSEGIATAEAGAAQLFERVSAGPAAH
jgi:hypothetical protein